MFYLPDGMIGDALPEAIGPGLNGPSGDVPGTDSQGRHLQKWPPQSGFKAGPFCPGKVMVQRLFCFAMQAANSTDSEVFKAKVMDVANAPGEKIFPGELGKALKLISEGKDVDYVGASAVELIGAGESAGNYAEIETRGKNVTVGYR